MFDVQQAALALLLASVELPNAEVAFPTRVDLRLEKSKP